MSENWERLVARWTAAGVLDEETATRIRAFESARAGSSRLQWPIWLALGFGVVAVGAGVLLFVSANWDSLSPSSRFALVLALVAVFHVAAAATVDRFPAMATALHAVGTLALGAGIFLSGQVFNLDEHWPGGLMLWAVGAALAWALLRSWPQLLLVAVLAPAWLVGEWTVATEYRSRAAFDVAACGVGLLALSYFTAVITEHNALARRALSRLGMLSLPFALLAVAAASGDTWSGDGPLSWTLAAAGWTVALGLPSILAAALRRQHAWPNAVAAAWMVSALHVRPAAGDAALYGWWALGAIGLTAWGVGEGRSERINMGAAAFGATVLAFYFSHVMDKLGRSSSLVGLGLVFLAGGWAIERIRRRLVSQARGGAA